MHRCVTVLYYKLFYFMEHHDMLDPLNEMHLYAVHYVFIPRINRSLLEFMHGWNHHPIRTAHHRSPHQLFTAGALLLQHSQLSALDFFHHVDDHYGVDEDGPIPAEEDTGIVIPEINFQVGEERFARLRQNVDPCAPSENYGMDLYEQTLQCISQ